MECDLKQCVHKHTTAAESRISGELEATELIDSCIVRTVGFWQTIKFWVGPQEHWGMDGHVQTCSHKFYACISHMCPVGGVVLYDIQYASREERFYLLLLDLK